MVLFELEKKQLKQLPNRDILIKYHSDFIEVKFNNACLVLYGKAKYGIPKEYINSTVLLNNSNNALTFYDKRLNKLANYPIYNSGIHYSEGLYSICSFKGESEDEIKKKIANNLSLLSSVVNLKIGDNSEWTIIIY